MYEAAVLSWRDVFDAAKKPACATIDHAAEIAAKAGYKFVAFNGNIYFVTYINGIDVHAYSIGLQVNT